MLNKSPRQRISSLRIQLLKWLVAIPFSRYTFRCHECNTIVHINDLEKHESNYHLVRLSGEKK